MHLRDKIWPWDGFLMSIRLIGRLGTSQVNGTLNTQTARLESLMPSLDLLDQPSVTLHFLSTINRAKVREYF